MQAPAVVNNHSVGTNRLVLDQENFKSIMTFAEMMAGGVSTVPKHLQKNRADCAAVIMQAMQWGMNPYAVAQKTHVVNGVLGYEAQLVNAVLNSQAPIKGRLAYEWFGPWEKVQGKIKEVTSTTKKDDSGQPKKYYVPAWEEKDEQGIGIRVSATLEGEDKPRVLELLLTQVRTRNSTLWAEDPKQQIAYLGTKKWARLYCPDVILGVYTPDELDYVQPEKDITSHPGAGVMPAADTVPTLDREKVLQEIASAQTSDELKPKWGAWAEQCVQENDLEKYTAIKAAVAARVEELKKAAEPPAETPAAENAPQDPAQ